jgi:acyl-homoserine-lactone acylase
MRALSWIGLLGVTAALAMGTAAAAAAAAGGGEILWDRYGVGHVYARNTEGLFYAYGFAQAKSHGEAVVKLYAQARGRAAEYYGPEELANDRGRPLARPMVLCSRQNANRQA